MSESNILISVIIPTFNREKTIKRALESVLNQTYKNFELIIVDDGSTDNTKEIISNYPQIKYIQTENQGVSTARNIGIENSLGSWIAFLDSDDEWHESKLEKQVNVIASQSEIKCIHTEEIWIRDGHVVKQLKKHKKGSGDQFIQCLDLCLIAPSSVLIKKEVFKEIGLFNPSYPVCEDYDLWLKLTSIYPISLIETPLVNKYGGHVDQLSFKYVAMDYWRIKSIHWILKNRNLAEDKRDNAISVLTKKARILLKGYIKHKNLKDYSEIENILNSY